MPPQRYLKLAITAIALGFLQADAYGQDAYGQSAVQAPLPKDLQERLDDYLQLLYTADRKAEDYMTFLRANPGWPQHGALNLYLQKSLIKEKDNAQTLAKLCPGVSFTLPEALLTCAHYLPKPSLATQARKLWVKSITTPRAEQQFLAVITSPFTPEDQQARFDYLIGHSYISAAKRQVMRLPSVAQNLAKARLAFRTLASDAERLWLPRLSVADKQSPLLTLERLAWARRLKRYQEALNLWSSMGFNAEKKSQHPRFWTERKILAQVFLQQNDTQAAFLLANDTTQKSAPLRQDADFLSGWIALEKEDAPRKALPFFRGLTLYPATPSMAARGYYWLGRTQAKLGQRIQARQSWQRAALNPIDFYGQMAILELDNAPAHISPHSSASAPFLQSRIRAISPVTPVSLKEKQQYKQYELAQCALWLLQNGYEKLATSFLTALDKKENTPRSHEVAAAVAYELGLYSVSVDISRQLTRQKPLLLKEGWPLLGWADALTACKAEPPALVLGIIRQESSFNRLATSPSGAVGLMQLMPQTAEQMVKLNRLPASLTTDLTDTQKNMTLGCAYLSYLLKRFDGQIPYTIAAYNAGPGNARKWAVAPFTTRYELIDWLESIPLRETRNYTRHVMENMAVYHAMLGR